MDEEAPIPPVTAAASPLPALTPEEHALSSRLLSEATCESTSASAAFLSRTQSVSATPAPPRAR